MQANEIPQHLRKNVISFESYIEGSKGVIREGTVRKMVMQVNSVLEPKGWEPLRVEVDHATTWFTRTTFFTLTGQAYPVQFFLDCLADTVAEHGGIFE